MKKLTRRFPSGAYESDVDAALHGFILLGLGGVGFEEC